MTEAGYTPNQILDTPHNQIWEIYGSVERRQALKLLEQQQLLNASAAAAMGSPESSKKLSNELMKRSGLKEQKSKGSDFLKGLGPGRPIR